MVLDLVPRLEKQTEDRTEIRTGNQREIGSGVKRGCLMGSPTD